MSKFCIASCCRDSCRNACHVPVFQYRPLATPIAGSCARGEAGELGDLIDPFFRATEQRANSRRYTRRDPDYWAVTYPPTSSRHSVRDDCFVEPIFHGPPLRQLLRHKDLPIPPISAIPSGDRPLVRAVYMTDKSTCSRQG
jgi:hypothetical protein